jgi:hypothetical protein
MKKSSVFDFEGAGIKYNYNSRIFGIRELTVNKGLPKGWPDCRTGV